VSKEIGFESIVSNYSGIRPYWIAKFELSEIRDKVSAHLSESAIESRSWWSMPLSEMSAFGKSPVILRNHNSKEICQTTVGLPLFRGIKNREIDLIAEKIDSVLRSL
jgi:dTDP-4-amino-4,6-dideoxygalactose transaminase